MISGGSQFVRRMDVLQRWRKSILIPLMMMIALTPGFAESPRKQVPVPHQGSTDTAFEMPVQQEPFRRVVEEFIAAAAGGDSSKIGQMISPDIASRTGPEAVERYITGQVLPFFAEFKEIAGSVTVTRTADAVGFAFYMYMVSRTNELRPFVIYVIEESGAKVIANALVDYFVDGRHCTRIADGWKCPDFS
jgi:hypothetical protein